MVWKKVSLSYVHITIKIVFVLKQSLCVFSFTLYIFRRVCIENLVLDHSVPQYPPNFETLRLKWRNSTLYYNYIINNIQTSHNSFYHPLNVTVLIASKYIDKLLSDKSNKFSSIYYLPLGRACLWTI